MLIGPLSVSHIQLICLVALRGDDSDANPVRPVNYYYNDDGTLMACFDPSKGEPDA
ncbi:MAG: hypothetical protein ACOYMG_22830 [Candidatus Methylumidiphilus sp.]